MEPKLILEDNGFVTIYDTNHLEIYYTIDGSEPTLNSNKISTGARVGPFTKGTIFKCRYYLSIDKVLSDVKTVTILDTTDVYLARKYSEYNDKLYITNLSRLGEYSSQEDIYGSIYYTVDGSDPLTNGTLLPLNKATNQGILNLFKECDYIIKYCIKYGDLHTDISQYKINNGTVDVNTPTYKIDDFNQVVITTNINATTIYTEIKKSNTDWIETKNLLYKQPIDCVLFVRNYVKYPNSQNTDLVKQYSDILTIPGVVPVPTINLDFINGNVIINNKDYLKTYYAIYKNDTLIQNYIEYTQPISLLNNKNNTIKAYSKYEINEENLIYTNNSDIVEETINVSTSLEKPIISNKQDTITITNPNLGGIVYYTIDNSEPDLFSNKYIEPFVLADDTIIKAIVIFDEFKSDITVFEYKYEVNNPTKPYIKKTTGENKPLSNKVVKSYVDIIFNESYEINKVLDSINYILSVINNQSELFNIVEEELNRQFSGNYLLIYSDNCYSGLLDIKQKNIINPLDNYKVPHKDKGIWNLNYFRNKITTPVTEEELQGYTTFPYYNSKTNKTEIKHINIAKLKQANHYNSITDRANLSDNRSLIYGKYFVIRFVFDNDNKIKLENINFNVQKY